MLELQKELKAAGEISIETVLRAPGVFRAPEEKLSTSDVWPHVEAALKGALGELVTMREREGKHLAKDLIKRVKGVRDNVRRIRELQPAAVMRYRQTLHERIQKAGVELTMDDERLTKEVIFFADRSDITEELTRLDSHFAQFAHMLRRTEPVGRTLEFMSQEIGANSTPSARRRMMWRSRSSCELQSRDGKDPRADSEHRMKMINREDAKSAKAAGVHHGEHGGHGELHRVASPCSPCPPWFNRLPASRSSRLRG
jgi:hypothetical protein